MPGSPIRDPAPLRSANRDGKHSAVRTEKEIAPGWDGRKIPGAGRTLPPACGKVSVPYCQEAINIDLAPRVRESGMVVVPATGAGWLHAGASTDGENCSDDVAAGEAVFLK